MRTRFAKEMHNPAGQGEVRQRRFGLVDAMILIGAIGTGCMLTRWVSQATEGMISLSSLLDSVYSIVRLRLDSRVSRGSMGLLVTEMAFKSVALLVPFLGTATGALLPMRLLVRRPGIGYSMSRPGMMSASASVLALVFLSLLATVVLLARGSDDAFLDLSAVDVIVFAPVFVSLAILSSWMTLLVSGRWSIEPSWIDRMGRVLGILWIATAFAIIGLYFHQLWYSPVCGGSGRGPS